MSEPWYQTQTVSVDEATREVKNGWFYSEICAQHNTFVSNQQLAVRIKQLNCSGSGSNIIGRGNPGAGNRAPNDTNSLLRNAGSWVGRVVVRQRGLNAASNATRITFERLRHLNPEWRSVLDRIISEELERERAKYDGFGSHRGFYTFVFNAVSQLVLARAIVELWARPTLVRTLNIYARAWIENRFALGGQGFYDSATHFDFLATTCHGCRAGMANQQAHMDPGGCLDILDIL